MLCYCFILLLICWRKGKAKDGGKAMFGVIFGGRIGVVLGRKLVFLAGIREYHSR